MKLEQAKALFFAQYLGQNVGYGIDHLMVNELTLNSNAAGKLKLSSVDKNCALLLRSVSQLTNDEITTIANSIGLRWPIIDRSLENRIRITDDSYKVYIFRDCLIQTFKNNQLYIDADLQMIVSILLRFGILIPFTHLNEESKPITLHPDEIIVLGWTKYQE